MPKNLRSHFELYLCCMFKWPAHSLFTGKFTFWFLLLCSIFSFSCAIRKTASQQQLTAPGISGLKYLAEYRIPNDLKYKGTAVGGLSGIDYDPSTNAYYLISDDRSDINPARFYRAKIGVSELGIDQVQFTGLHFLRNPDGKYFPKAKENILQSTDPESIRYNPLRAELIWTAEGERIFKGGQMLLLDPTLTISSKKGAFKAAIPIPEHLRMQALESGPRRNGGLEGLSFADDFNEFYASMEEPLYQDGPRAAFVPNGAIVRIFRYDLSSRQWIAEYAYELDPVVHRPQNPGVAYNNGVVDLLWLGKSQFIITERSYTADHEGSSVRLYLADFSAAENIQGIAGLKAYPEIRKVKKTLLLDLDKLGMRIDNLEGATLGPLLPNGNRTLLMIADNNYSAKQISQLLLFELIP